MKKLVLIAALVLAALLGYTIAGPYLAINGIREAIRDEDAGALSRHVDFPPLRASLKAQLTDRLLRSAGMDAPSGLLGALGASIAGGVVGGAVDLMVTPGGLGAMMEGRKVWNRGAGLPPPSTSEDTSDRPDPLQGARHRFESTSRFTATIHAEDGEPIVFVLTRDGIHWRLSDIRLP